MLDANGCLLANTAMLLNATRSERPGYDYFETFVPTVHMATIRMVLALAALEDPELHSLDISQASINGNLDIEIYMEMPEGWDEAQKGKVLYLKKALHGYTEVSCFHSPQI